MRAGSERAGSGGSDKGAGRQIQSARPAITGNFNFIYVYLIVKDGVKGLGPGLRARVVGEERKTKETE